MHQQNRRADQNQRTSIAVVLPWSLQEDAVEKPSEKRVREKAEAIRRARKLARRNCSARACCR
jgi:hypothetical protein